MTRHDPPPPPPHTRRNQSALRWHSQAGKKNSDGTFSFFYAAQSGTRTLGARRRRRGRVRRTRRRTSLTVVTGSERSGVVCEIMAQGGEGVSPNTMLSSPKRDDVSTTSFSSDIVVLFFFLPALRRHFLVVPLQRFHHLLHSRLRLPACADIRHDDDDDADAGNLSLPRRDHGHSRRFSSAARARGRFQREQQTGG